jgi:hypothetical protein
MKILHQNNFSLQFACKNSFFIENSASKFGLGKALDLRGGIK